MKVVQIDQVPWSNPAGRKGVKHRWALDGKTTDNKHFELIFSVQEKGGHGPLHNHPHSEHVLIVTQGELTLSNETEKHVVPAGSFILLEAGEMHEVNNTFDGETHYMAIYSPPL